MANDPKPKTNKRRPSIPKSPLSAGKKSAQEKTKSTFKKTVTKVSNNKRPQRLAAKKPRAKKVLSKKPASVARKSQKKTSRSTKRQITTTETPIKHSPTASRLGQKQLISIPLGARMKIVLSINRSAAVTPRKNSKLAGKKIKARLKKHERLVSSVFLIVGLSGSLFFGSQAITSPLPPPPKQPAKIQKVASLPSLPKKVSLPRSQPTHLRIPDIQVDAGLTTVGLQQDGTLEVPTEYTSAGWYRLGPAPGEVGPAVIAGHYDNIHGVAVFGRLYELAPGQSIEVTREDGKKAQFVVESVKQFSQGNFPSSEIYGNTKEASLRLITCSGSFNRLTQRYSDNTVVFATLISTA